MRRSRMTDQQGRWIEDNSESGESHHYHACRKKGETGWRSLGKVGQVDLGF
jgi:hypothetical protein